MKRLLTIVVLAIAIVESVFSQDFDKKNLLFRVNPDGNNTVELLGFEKKPKEELIIPEEVSYKGTKYAVSVVSESAFKNCEVLTKVVGVTIQEVKEGAFEGCKNLASAVFTNQLNSIGKRAFQGCASLQEIAIGDNIQAIDDAAFAGCSSLHELSLGNSLKSIGTGIINETGISTINLPSSLSIIGHDAFAHCKSLSSVTLTEGLKIIESNAFTSTSIISIDFPKTLESIGEKAFADCVDLKSISLKNGLKDIGSSAFARTSIEQLVLPNSLKEVKASTFEGCEVLKTISLGDDIEDIRDKAFANCRQLTVDFSNVPCNIAENAFMGCKEAIIGDYSLKGLSKITRNFTFEDKTFKNGLLKVSKNGKFGFINKMGQQVLPCIFDEATNGSKGIHVIIDGKEGFYLHDGTVLFNCEYDLVFDEYERGIFVVEKNGQQGVFDIKGKEIMPCIYQRCKISDLIWCESPDMWYAADLNGKIIAKVSKPEDAEVYVSDFIYDVAYVEIKYYSGEIERRIIDNQGHSCVVSDYYYLEHYSNGLFFVSTKESKVGLIDKNNNIVLPTEYDGIDSNIIKKMADNRVVLKGAIDNTGKVVIPCKYEDVAICNRFTAFRDKGGKWRVNMNGEVVEVDGILGLGSEGEVVNGLTRVWKDGKCGCLDGEGKQIVPFICDYIESISEGMFLVRSNDKYGYIDITGKEIIPMELTSARDFHEGMAIVEKEGKKYLIDKSGNLITSLDYDYVGDFHDGMAYVLKDGKLGYIDKTGKLSVPCVYKGIDIDKIINPSFDSDSSERIEDFNEGLAFVFKGDRQGFVDKNGKSTFDY